MVAWGSMAWSIPAAAPCPLFTEFQLQRGLCPEQLICIILLLCDVAVSTSALFYPGLWFGLLQGMPLFCEKWDERRVFSLLRVGLWCQGLVMWECCRKVGIISSAVAQFGELVWTGRLVSVRSKGWNLAWGSMGRAVEMEEREAVYG